MFLSTITISPYILFAAAFLLYRRARSAETLLIAIGFFGTVLMDMYALWGPPVMHVIGPEGIPVPNPEGQSMRTFITFVGVGGTLLASLAFLSFALNYRNPEES